MSGPLYTFDEPPPDARYVSILRTEHESPLTHVAFPWEGGWTLRTSEPLPQAALLWISDGETVDLTQWVIVTD